MFTRLESRISSDVRIILQLLQRQMPMIPPSYSTLTISSNTTTSSILSPTFASSSSTLNLICPATNPEQWVSNENQARHRETSVLHLTVSPSSSDASATHTSSYQPLIMSSIISENTCTSTSDLQASPQSSSSDLTQTGSHDVPSLTAPYTSPSSLPSSREA